MTDRRQPGWLTLTEMAASCGVSRQAFHAWGVEPVATIGRERYFTAAVVVENRIRHRRVKENRCPTCGGADHATCNIFAGVAGMNMAM